MARRALEPAQTSCGRASVERSPRWTLAGCPVLTHDDFHDGNRSRGPRAHGPRAETEHPLRRARVLVADSLPLFRAGVRNLLRRESDLEVLEAGSSDEAAALLAGGYAEIALIDLALPPTGGIDLVRRVRSRTRAAMIVWSLEPSRDAVLESITAGAHGFLHKEISPTGLVRALRGTVNGEAPLSRDMAALMIDAIHTLEARSKARERAAVLSEREKEVLAFVSRGARNREIAEALAISEFTVKRHMQNILQKLDVPSRRAAAAFYVSAYRDRAVAEGSSA
jgi:DNA-binding NarL/FixJ family response regulator